MNVSRGGTGLSGASAANGTLLIGNGSGYTLATLTDGTGITITEGAGSITIASTLGTDISGSEIVDGTIEEVDLEATNAATDGYILSYDNATGGFTWISNTGGSGASKWTDSGTITYVTNTTDDVAIGGSTATASRFFFDVTTGNQIIFEGTGVDDAFETTLVITNPTADRSITIPNITGTLVTTGDTGSVTGTMILNDTIALGTDTAGNYVASLANGNGITGGAAGSESATLTLGLDLLDVARHPGQVLGAVRGDEHVVLDPHSPDAAEALHHVRIQEP